MTGRLYEKRWGTIKHTFIKSKMKKGKALEKDPILYRHVPVTRWYRRDTLYRMMAAFPVIYIKPDKGTGGSGIIRIKQIGRSHSLVSFNQRTIRCPNKRVAAAVSKRMAKGQKYIIQQGITLATYRKKPFDLRIVLMKPADRWLMTWMSAKVAPRSNAIVTNVAKGARDARIEPILWGTDQRLNAANVWQQLIRLSYRIAYRLGSRYPVRIVGLDMGIDTKGKAWFIEANTKPNFHGLSKLDPVQYQRYLRIKRIMKAKMII